MAYQPNWRRTRKLSIGPMPVVRANLLKTMPDNIRFYVRQGKSAAEIKEMYWNCGEFTEWWKLLQLGEATLDFLISNTLAETVEVVS